MESNVLKRKSFHAKPSHFANNKSALTNMDADNRSGVKTKQHTNVDKENFNPNRKTHKTLGEVVKQSVNSNVRTMLNHNKVSTVTPGHVKEETPLADTIRELHINEKLEKATISPDSTTHDQHSNTHAKQPIPQCYIDAIKQLNSLQSNVKALKESRIKRDPAETKAVQVDQVLRYLGHLNVTADDIRKLRFIHISGTKGKGSTSAYCESILRSHGFSTGFFSSPHLIEVRERIKLNGQPISYEMFTKYFWTVYNSLHAKRSHPDDMPAYFKFLTVMSFYMFVKEKPDVCIMEVGIGGLYDNTNIVPNTDVVGITSLGYDHTAVLGNTMEQIAAQKAGIMKPGCIAVTSSQQKDTCKRVLLDKAKSLDCVILEAPHILHYDWKGQALDEDWESTVQSINISLAIQLAYLWMFRMNRAGDLKATIDKFLAGINSNSHSHSFLGKNYPNPNAEQNVNTSLSRGLHFEIDPKTYRGIRDCLWPGRIQVIRKNNFKYFLDGAHTSDSLALCSQWYQKKSREEASLGNGRISSGSTKTGTVQLKETVGISEPNSLKDPTQPTDGLVSFDLKESNQHLKNSILPNQHNSICQILVFNLTGDRDPATLLPSLLQSNQFDYILVTPNQLTNETSPDSQYGGNRTIDRYGKKIAENIEIRQHDSSKDPTNSDHLKINPSDRLSGRNAPREGIFPSIKTDSVDQVTDSIRPPNGQTFLNSVDTFNTVPHADKLSSVQKIVNVASAMSSRSHTKVIAFENVLDTYNFKHKLDPSRQYHVLVTGSLHLVGAFLNVLTNYD